ncbi:tyrosine--tRNA ligase [Paenibacillus glucanolyticus]|uniref:Tyrosine--tRNA ligase n=3 Tax=Paenibacillus glucanolyticus TaxID=59843 RepID=A0A163FB50_9BACL|nr:MULTISPECIES: tyrosine--tRNA ligase [Paenibacillus]ANA78856.1 tyrosine--tRNA ligase [Paenibacillus glucanolyticus]AVV57228.1 tyrosine--tRNA ligase [Paenibacillus glucanolyticus]AWP26390.1 tyrosine--tRNA ligase [Paenibacillus sp. Cedars]ETT32025.1 tyrosyl-tRNA ligase [Paenibacillus sp. FSL R5-808]KZS44261.1 tyrosine--tRNA ligase [Paenibacillus glucanolyticus]
MNIIDELEWRDAINQQTDAEGLRELTNEKSISLYCGVDPTGDSMHIGHLIPFIMLKRFQLAGHRPVILIGGATGTIGDPSGRQTERSLQTLEQVQANVDALTGQMKKLFVTEGDNQIRMVNNYDWTHKISIIEFLRDFGKNFSINSMLAKDVVASRLDSGISFTEFTYQILQSVDYLHLFQHEDVQLQIGGSDQWGNITSGLDLIRKKEGSEAKAFGLTIPLMLKADGTKFGKTAGGAIWLDPNKTTPFEFYQFWANTDDRDVVKYLKYFTFLSKEQIDELAEKVQSEPHKREAQKMLAEEMTKFVHGEEMLEQAKRITAALFTGDIQSLTAEEIEQGFKEMPTFEATQEPKNIVDWLVDLGIEPSKRQAREDITKGAISMNGERVSDLEHEVTADQAIGGRFIIIRKGKKNYSLVKMS